MEQEKKGVINTVVEGFKESTKNIHEINKENMAEIKANSKANFESATTPSPEFENFKQAKGIKGKAKAVVEGFKSSTAATSEKEKQRREEIKSHEGYRTILEQQREHTQSAINKK